MLLRSVVFGFVSINLMLGVERKRRQGGGLSLDTRLPLSHVASFPQLQDLVYNFASH